jgi:hypothetical protein
MNPESYRLLKSIADRKRLPLPPITETFGSPAWVAFLVKLDQSLRA